MLNNLSNRFEKNSQDCVGASFEVFDVLRSCLEAFGRKLLEYAGNMVGRMLKLFAEVFSLDRFVENNIPVSNTYHK